MREEIAPEVFPEEPDAIWPDCDLGRNRFAAGLPMLNKTP
jgi:hypothetical protein